MKFTIKDCVVCGFCGDQAAIAQGKEVRLLNVDPDAWKALLDRQHFISDITCKMYETGVVYITGVSPTE